MRWPPAFQLATMLVGRQHVERAVSDIAHQQTKLALAGFEIGIGLAPLGDVAGHHGVTHELALLIDRVDHRGHVDFRAVLADAPALGRGMLGLAGGLQVPSRMAGCAVLGK